MDFILPVVVQNQFVIFELSISVLYTKIVLYGNIKLLINTIILIKMWFRKDGN